MSAERSAIKISSGCHSSHSNYGWKTESERRFRILVSFSRRNRHEIGAKNCKKVLISQVGRDINLLVSQVAPLS